MNRMEPAKSPLALALEQFPDARLVRDVLRSPSAASQCDSLASITDPRTGAVKVRPFVAGKDGAQAVCAARCLHGKQWTIRSGAL